jgi:hypothetical protein
MQQTDTVQVVYSYYVDGKCTAKIRRLETTTIDGTVTEGIYTASLPLHNYSELQNVPAQPQKVQFFTLLPFPTKLHGNNRNPKSFKTS